ncbi:Na+/proline symporter [Winogradskyella wandonensis]|uniref:histidine kinase n=1 Tax=Winogradskyella wandonensis TaxID=1442586 RepID=A0A4R1KW58_9FLAO|nr:sensor histidine kinase [Winogradskyella wandonensis]TCK69394.1 Na+/proline symporter [Winogradskyella wandonensis]
MSNYVLFFIIIIYLSLLFGIAFYAEKKSKNRWVNSPIIYALAMAVYCTAWTYYGSIGIAATSGIDFLPIYLGPVIAAPLWILLLRKVIRISKQHKISSIADFISLRYGNHRFLGALVTIICLLGIIPYIALQLQAVSETFQILADDTSYVSKSIYDDSTLYIALILAVFATFFGTQSSDASVKHKGILVSVAFESVIKLIFFLCIGVYVTYVLFDGTEDIYTKMSQFSNFERLTIINGFESGFNWMYTILLSFMAIFLLPRQFQVSVVENVREKHLKTAIWLFPLYLLLFNIFVIFIAWGGNLAIGNPEQAEYYALLLPLQNDNTFLASLVFLGGFSAVISMVVVSTLALSTMLSNNLIIPYGFLDRFLKNHPDRNAKYIKNIRRISIFSIIILAYAFYVNFSYELSLYSIGLMAFVIIAQLAPAFFIGLFWNRGSSKATIIGIIAGFSVVFYTLILPFSIQALTGSDDFVEYGFYGISSLKPHALFGIDFLSPPAHAFFWSMLVNCLCYALFSLLYKGNYRERNYAEMFIDSKNYKDLQDGALVWKGEAYVAEIKNVLNKFLGEERTNRALNLFFKKYNISPEVQMADARLINFSEKLLTGSIGSASAKILISSVVKEEEVSLVEVLKILEESKETIARNKLLREKSEELTKLTDKLSEANEELIQKDLQKDEFLDTVAHELKTPITGIRASTELLIEDAEMPKEIQAQFLSNMLQDSDRLSRLIQNILDFEKLSNGRSSLNFKKNNIRETIQKAIGGLRQIASKKNIKIISSNTSDVFAVYDEDKIWQVLTNLISNAIKYCKDGDGIIIVDYKYEKGLLEVTVNDNGTGIPNADMPFIFDKFFQSKNQNIIKPHGSGLGLAISKQIIDKHKGSIWAKNNKKNGVTFGFYLPFK